MRAKPIQLVLATLLLGLLTLAAPSRAEEKRHKAIFGNPPETTLTPGIPGTENPSLQGFEHATEPGTTSGPLKELPPLQGAKLKPAHVTVKDSLGLSQPCQKKLSLEALLEVRFPAEVQSDPAQGVYFLSPAGNSVQLFHLRSPSHWPEQKTFVDGDVERYQISPNGEKLALITSTRGSETQELVVVDLKSQQVESKVSGFHMESMAWDPSSGSVIFDSHQKDKQTLLQKYATSTRQVQRLLELSSPCTVTDVAPDGKQVALTCLHSKTEAELFVWNSGKRTLTGFAPPQKNVWQQNGKFTKDATHILFLSDQRGGVHEILIAPSQDPKKARLFAGSSWGIESFQLSRDRLALLYLTNKEGYSQPAGMVLDPEGNKRRAIPTPKKAPGVISSFDFLFREPLRGFYYAYSSSVQPSNLWFFESSKDTQWTNHTYGTIVAECLTGEQLVHYPSFDNKKISAFLYRPSKSSGPIRFVIYLAEGPLEQYRPAFQPVVQFFLERGFGVFAPNVRGTLGYGRAHHEADNQKGRLDSVADVVAGARWLISQRHSSPAKLFLFGKHYGGFLAVRAIQSEAQLFSAVAAIAPIITWTTYRDSLSARERGLLENEFGFSDPKVIGAASILGNAVPSKKPLILFSKPDYPFTNLSVLKGFTEEIRSKGGVIDFQEVTEPPGALTTGSSLFLNQAKQALYFFEKHSKEKGS